jgi:hypothetical protein
MRRISHGSLKVSLAVGISPVPTGEILTTPVSAQPRVLVAQLWVLVAQQWALVAQPWVLVAQLWVHVAQPWALVAQPWVLVAQPWTRVAQLWDAWGLAISPGRLTVAISAGARR